MKIYTKTGDQGTSSLYNGQRLPKNDPTFIALGAIDECNCTLGAAIAALPQLEDVKNALLTVQHTLFDLGAAVATPLQSSAEKAKKKTRFDSSGTEKLETWIDEMEKVLPPLKTFILPGGHMAGAFLHMARGFCRRAERHTISLLESGQIEPEVSIYLNRLSDYLFVASRYVNHQLNAPETPWHPHQG